MIVSVIAGGPSKKTSSGTSAAAGLAAAFGFSSPPLRFPLLAYFDLMNCRENMECVSNIWNMNLFDEIYASALYYDETKNRHTLADPLPKLSASSNDLSSSTNPSSGGRNTESAVLLSSTSANRGCCCCCVTKAGLDDARMEDTGENAFVATGARATAAIRLSLVILLLRM